MTLDASDPRQRLRQWWRDLVATPTGPSADLLWADVRARHPRFGTAVLADARITAANRGDRFEYRSSLDAAVQAMRLAFVTDSFLAQVCYRAKATCQARRIPVVPRILNHLAIVTGQICIGDPVVVQPGVYIPHGQIVIDGLTRVGSGAVLSPFVTLGLVAGEVMGPDVEARVMIGTGAKIVGPVVVGEGAKIGANAVVVADVPAGATAVGVPARVVT